MKRFNIASGVSLIFALCFFGLSIDALVQEQYVLSVIGFIGSLILCLKAYQHYSK